MIVVSDTGVKIMDAHSAWMKYCRENHIEDPFELIRKCHDKVNTTCTKYDEKGYPITYIDFHSYDEWPPDAYYELQKLEKYRDKYMSEERVWEGKYILKNFGYNVLSIFAQANMGDEPYNQDFKAWYAMVRPCDGPQGQCNMYCNYFNECERIK